ncbi:hypothetical protein Q8791_27115 [Nocardiopsis sp. CT-R113]|uniref:Insecticidal crystal toxin domain-containing protein n=1 Tax=Nocardiopsis codii TaxID=3065942 RepID=A0ABU7KF77_9ACTN|nr:hypothetical protein [Nocardiopsis sp. CT-R113]MEE2040896.1 hypothetical protein [Nocardiopsis sp. CT-R113]
MITQRYGDLEIAFTTSFTRVFPKHPENPWPAVWRPDAPQGWFVFGDLAVHSAEDPNGRRGAVIARDLSGGHILKPVTTLETINTASFGSMKLYDIVRPTPPSGYAAVGDFFTNINPAFYPGVPAPDLGRIAVVAKSYQGRSYVRASEIAGKIHTQDANSVSGAVGLWEIGAPMLPGDDQGERLLLPLGTFTVVGHTDKPSPTASTFTLDLPAVVDKLDVPGTPQLTSYAPPPQEQVLVDRTVTVPYFMVTDPGRDEAWKIANSPFYKLQRKRHFGLVKHVDYQGAGGGKISESVEEGVTREKEETFSRSTGISVSETVGVEVSAGIFGMGASVSTSTTTSQSIETGYASRYNVATMRSRTVTVEYDVPADHAGALWTDEHELIPIRGDGSVVVTTGLSFPTNNYVGRAHPPLTSNPVDIIPGGSAGAQSLEEADPHLFPAGVAEALRSAQAEPAPA